MRWVKHSNLHETASNEEQYSVFNSTEDYKTIVRPAPAAYRAKNVLPYKNSAGHTNRGRQDYPQNQLVYSRKTTSSNQSALPRNMNLRTLGYKKGLLSDFIGANLRNPSLIVKIFNNSLVVNAFMGRPAIKPLLNNPAALKQYLSQSPEVLGFLEHPVVQQVFNNSNLMNALAGTKLANAIMDSPSAQHMVKHPEEITSLIIANPQSAALALNPNVLGVLASNPVTQGAYSKVEGAIPQ